MEQLGELVNMIEEVKTKLTDKEYKDLMEKTKEINDKKKYDKLYKLKYIHQYIKNQFQDINNPAHTSIFSEIKTQIVKFHKDWNEHMINTFIENVGNLERIQSISFMNGRDDIPEIYHDGFFGEWIRSNPDGEDDDENTLIRFKQVIPLAIEEL